MTASSGDRDWVHPDFFENQRNFPAEELLQYAGQRIAWSWDGSRVLASAPDEQELRHKLAAAGHDPRQVVYDYVPPPDLSFLG